MLGQYRPGLTEYCEKLGSKVLLLSAREARVARVGWSTKSKEYILYSRDGELGLARKSKD